MCLRHTAQQPSVLSATMLCHVLFIVMPNVVMMIAVACAYKPIDDSTERVILYGTNIDVCSTVKSSEVA